MSEEADFQRLCEAQIEGTATDAERADLAALLRDTESARRDYVEQMRIHAFLNWQHGRSQATLVEVSRSANVLRFPAIVWRGVAAALLALCGLAAWWQFGTSRSGASFEVLAAAEVPFHLGEQAKRGRLAIDRGSLSFRLTSGAVVDVMGPAVLELISPMHLRLLRGNLTVDVGTTAKGFIIDTADAQVVDLGTRFGVSADPQKATDIAVFEGSVEVYQSTGAHNGKPDTTLTAGDALRIDKTRGATRLKMIALGADAKSLGSQRASDLISGVTDNVAETTFRGYYGLLRGGMGEGARVYTTGHTRTWHALPGGTFPEELIGADGICTFGVDGKESGLQITLQISHACDLYVMTDARVPAPDWVAKKFTDTGLHLRSGPWIPRGVSPEEYGRFSADESAYVPYTVWKKRINAPGPVLLGSPVPDAGGKRAAMYGIAVKAVR